MRFSQRATTRYAPKRVPLQPSRIDLPIRQPVTQLEGETKDSNREWYTRGAAEFGALRPDMRAELNSASRSVQQAVPWLWIRYWSDFSSALHLILHGFKTALWVSTLVLISQRCTNFPISKQSPLRPLITLRQRQDWIIHPPTLTLLRDTDLPHTGGGIQIHPAHWTHDPLRMPGPFIPDWRKGVQGSTPEASKKPSRDNSP